MWSKRTAHALRLSEDHVRRKGAKMGILIALMAVVPGIVAGTTYTNLTSTGTATTTGASTADTLGCTWQSLATTDSFILLTGAGTSTLTATLTELRGSGYQYSVDEIALQCSGNDVTDSVTVTASEAAQATCSGSCTPPGTGTLTPVYAIQVAEDSCTGGACTGSNVAPTATTNPNGGTGGSCVYPSSGPTLYNPEESGASMKWADFDAYAASTITEIPTCTTASVTGNAFTLQTWAGTTTTNYVWICFALLNTPTAALTTEPKWVLSFSATD